MAYTILYEPYLLTYVASSVVINQDELEDYTCCSFNTLEEACRYINPAKGIIIPVHDDGPYMAFRSTNLFNKYFRSEIQIRPYHC